MLWCQSLKQVPTGNVNPVISYYHYKTLKRVMSWAQTEQKAYQWILFSIKDSMRPDVTLVMRHNCCLTLSHTLMFSSTTEFHVSDLKRNLCLCSKFFLANNIPKLWHNIQHNPCQGNLIMKQWHLSGQKCYTFMLCREKGRDAISSWIIDRN